jgi:NADPH-dependent 2,4-dienoyl-CoA reductase/sulfur reductase-like enzyme/rhodanese-related sulfurtransferase
MMKIAIVGGVAGGASAAARARRLSENAEIILFERGIVPSFANCGLPYYIGGEIIERSKLLVAPKELLEKRFRLDVRTLQSVEKINREKKTIQVKNLVDGTVYEESYDKLILSPGASPFKPPIPGVDHPGVFTLRDLKDADMIHQMVHEPDGNAVVIGAGFIGLEMAENLERRGWNTVVIELADQILPPWDKEMVEPISQHLKEKGVKLILSDSAVAIEKTEQGLSIKLKSGEIIDARFVIMSVGVRPENSLAVDSGLDVGPRGGIQVNTNMQTKDPDIYAVGDAVEVFDFVTGHPTQIPLAGPANRQGRIAANHIFGKDSHFRGIQGTAIVSVFDMTAAMTGQSEKALIQKQLPYEKIYTHPASHAGYYPGAEGMSIKLMFAPDTGKVLGAEIIGRSGVDKRIDVLAVAIQAGMTVEDLEEMELAYAPQYGSAKDPVNMAGFVAAGVLRGDHSIVHSVELHDEDFVEHFLLDVRTPSEFEAGHIKGSVNIPVDELRDRMDEIPCDQKIVVYCKVGLRGYIAKRILIQCSFDVANLSGGFTTYQHIHGT